MTPIQSEIISSFPGNWISGVQMNDRYGNSAGWNTDYYFLIIDESEVQDVDGSLLPVKYATIGPNGIMLGRSAEASFKYFDDVLDFKIFIKNKQLDNFR